MGSYSCLRIMKSAEEEIKLANNYLENMPYNNINVINSILKIQMRWRFFISFKKMIKQKLIDAFKFTDINSIISIEEMITKISKHIVEIDYKLGRFNPQPELYFYPFSILREPILLNDGSIYYGSWNIYGLKHGYGILIRKQGSKYEGFFENDKLCGRGRYIDSQGAFYYEGI